MKYLIAILMIVFLAGCADQPKMAAPETPSTVAPEAVNPSVSSPEAPKIMQFPPNATYLKGYRDGYYGTWLAPVRWLVTDDYRNGWSAGSYDRTHHLPNKFDKK